MTDRKYQVMLDKETHRKLKILSLATGKTMGDVIKLLIEDVKYRDWGISTGFWEGEKWEGRQDEALAKMKTKRKRLV